MDVSLFILIKFLRTGGEVSGEILLKSINEVRNEVNSVRDEVHTLAIGQHILNEKLPKITEVLITPSEYNKSIHKDVFMDLIDMFGFGRERIVSKVESFTGTYPLNSEELNYVHQWKRGQQETDSYQGLQEHLRTHGIDTVVVGEGQGLPDKILYHEELWTLKKNTLLRSEDLKKTNEQPVFKYILEGRTDLVRVRNSANSLGKSNNRYFIEIKREVDFVEEDSLREAVLELIGGNASNSFHSPPVLLTNLARMHYVLYISLVGDPTLRLEFKLNVVRMPSFGVAVAFAEELTAEMKSVTQHLGKKPTPPSSPPQTKNISKPKDEDEDITERFENVSLEEVQRH